MARSVPGATWPAGRRGGAGEDRPGLLPALDDGARVVGDPRVVQLEPGDGARQVAIVGDHRAGVGERCHGPGEHGGGRLIDAIGGDARGRRGRDAVADAHASVVSDVDVGGAGGGQVLGALRQPDAVDAGRLASPAELDEPGPVTGRAAVDEHEHRGAGVRDVAGTAAAAGCRPGSRHRHRPGAAPGAGEACPHRGPRAAPSRSSDSGPRPGAGRRAVSARRRYAAATSASPSHGRTGRRRRRSAPPRRVSGARRAGRARRGDVKRRDGLTRDADRSVLGEREGERHVADRPVPRDKVIELGLGGRHGAPVALRLEPQPRVEGGCADPDVEEPRRARAARPQQRRPLRRPRPGSAPSAGARRCGRATRRRAPRRPPGRAPRARGAAPPSSPWCRATRPIGPRPRSPPSSAG